MHRVCRFQAQRLLNNTDLNAGLGTAVHLEGVLFSEDKIFV